MKVSKDGVSAICRKRRPRSKTGACRDEAGVYVRMNGKTIWRKLGIWGSPEVEANYHRVCLEFKNYAVDEAEEVHSLAFLFNSFLSKMGPRLSKSDRGHSHTVIRLTMELYPALPIPKFNAMCFRNIQQHVAQHGERQLWCRNYTNKTLKHLRQIINWGVSYDMVPPEVAAKVRSVPAIRAGEYDLEEKRKLRRCTTMW